MLPHRRRRHVRARLGPALLAKLGPCETLGDGMLDDGFLKDAPGTFRYLGGGVRTEVF